MEKDRGAATLDWRWRWGIRTLQIAALAAVVGLMVFFGTRQVREKVETVKPVQFIGHADDASYALMGKSLAEGHGIHVNYVSTFFIPYPRTITRREDHWPPFMGFAIAPFFYVMGVHPWVARLPEILFGSIGLPLMTGLLAYALSRRGYVALVAGLIMMADPGIYEQSLRTLSDVATAMLVAGFCASVILGRRRPWWYVAAGAFAAGAYYAKGSELILLALYPVMALLCAGPRVFTRKRFYLGGATALLLLGPFWYANYREYGNPLHSTQNYVSGFYGFEDWETMAYFPYWGKDLPKTSDRWTKHPGEYWRMSRAQVATAAQYALTGAGGGGDVWADFGTAGFKARDYLIGRRPTSFAATLFRRPATARPMRPIKSWQSPAWELAGIGAVGLLAASLAMLPVLAGVGIWKIIRRFRRRGTPAAAAPAARAGSGIWTRWITGPALAVWLVLAAQIAFIAYFWQVEPRFCFPLLPLALALGCAAATRFIEWPIAAVLWAARWIVQIVRRHRPAPAWAATAGAILRHWPTAATLVLAAFVWVNRERVYGAQNDVLDRANARGDYMFEQNDRFVATGRWIAKKLPRAIIMCRNPWELDFYMADTNKAIGLPNPEDGGQEGADQIFAIARYYGVTHILADDMRPSLEPYLLRRKPGLTRVKGAPDALFEIDWSKIPYKTVEQALGRAPASAPATQR